MSQEYRFESPDDHVVVVDEDGRRILLDTGSPITFGEVRPDWLGVESPLRRSRQGFDFEALSHYVGTEVHGLVGTDVLAQVPFRINWRDRTVEFHCGAPPVGAKEQTATLLTGVPIVDFDVAGRRVRGLLDTGAVLSFFSVDPEQLPEAVGHRREFVPARLDEQGTVRLKPFDTPVWRLPVVFGSAFEACFGRFPAGDKPCPWGSREIWILGSDLWKLGLVQFDLPRGRIFVGGSVTQGPPSSGPRGGDT